MAASSLSGEHLMFFARRPVVRARHPQQRCMTPPLPHLRRVWNRWCHHLQHLQNNHRKAMELDRRRVFTDSTRASVFVYAAIAASSAIHMQLILSKKQVENDLMRD